MLQFQFQSNFDTNGVLYHIGTAGGTLFYQNPHTAGDVVVSWSGVGGGSVDHFVQHRHASPVASYTNNVVNSWMQVDLGPDRSLRPTHYCLRHDATNGHAPMNWRLEGSNDGTNWTTLSNHTNDQSMLQNQCMSEANFTLANVNERYRWFRIFQHGPNASRRESENNHLMCAGIELYGDLREDMMEEARRMAEARRIEEARLGGRLVSGDCTSDCISVIT